MPRIKVCGVTDAAFAVEAARRDVDYLGLIFAAGSPRQVTMEKAREIVTQVRSGAVAVSVKPPRFVGVFVRHSPVEIVDVASRVGLDVIQLHGDYDDSAVAMLKANGYEVWRLFNEVGSAAGANGGVFCVESPEDAVLLDGRRGNESRRADWSLVVPLKHAGRRVVLAGGISAGNIAAAVATGADVIDVNSSIETSPGVKSLDRLDELLRSVDRRRFQV